MKTAFKLSLGTFMLLYAATWMSGVLGSMRCFGRASASLPSRFALPSGDTIPSVALGACFCAVIMELVSLTSLSRCMEV